MFKYIPATALLLCLGTTAFSSENEIETINKGLLKLTLTETNGSRSDAISDSEGSPKTPRDEIDGKQFNGSITFNNQLYYYKIISCKAALRGHEISEWKARTKNNPLGGYILNNNNLFTVKFYDQSGNTIIYN